MTIETNKNRSIYDLTPQPNGAILTEKEINILIFINEFGFCEIKQIMKRFDMKKSSAYLHMQMLTRLQVVIHVRIVPDRPGAFYLTPKGIKLLELDLPAIRKISISIYEHHIAVIDVHLKLREFYPDAIWISERRLVREKYDKGCRRNEHMPDGVLVFPDGYQCAIEVERSLKARSRLEEILLGYGLQRSFKEVWYFCAPGIFNTINEVAHNLKFVKTYHLSEYLI